MSPENGSQLSGKHFPGRGRQKVISFARHPVRNKGARFPEEQ